MGLKVVNVYRALPAPAVFPTFATHLSWCRLLFYASIRPEAW